MKWSVELVSQAQVSSVKKKVADGWVGGLRQDRFLDKGAVIKNISVTFFLYLLAFFKV